MTKEDSTDLFLKRYAKCSEQMLDILFDEYRKTESVGCYTSACLGSSIFRLPCYSTRAGGAKNF